MFDRESIAIMDFDSSLRYDVGLLRSSPAVSKNIKLYGFFDINSGKLAEVCGTSLLDREIADGFGPTDAAVPDEHQVTTRP